MKTVCYYIESCAELNLTLNVISETIPCWADWRPLEEEENYTVITIECREEDIPYIQKMLAPFV